MTSRLSLCSPVPRAGPKRQTGLDGDLLMNVTLKPFDFAQAVARAGLAANGQPLAAGNAVEAGGFQQALTRALGAVSESQNGALRLQREVQLDNPTVSLEETMVAMQKAQLGFQATLQVRNRLVQAYSDIMNMQV
jgi:flagellar hook-basal body complex protein FliE